VALDPEVIEYLDSLAAKQDRSRSWIVNNLAKDHAQQNGVKLGQLRAS
jgi:predicted transcriptional regulator